MISISKRSNFSDEISIENKLKLNEEDNKFIEEELNLDGANKVSYRNIFQYVLIFLLKLVFGKD